ncbi:hypothetical protein L1049_009495 [Liquidambar formosana]|uniref:PUM-HD domain-containing protein n=1 Tax=Liquidambar formosana TaxID=63359 RepID=A0AAP0N5S4_LIQFO
MAGSSSNSSSPSETPNPWAYSVHPSVDTLLFPLENLCFNDGGVDGNQAGTSMGSNSIASRSSLSPMKTQQLEVANDSQHWTGLDNLSRIPIREAQEEFSRPLNSEDIFGNYNFCNGGKTVVGNLTGETMSVTTSYQAPFMSNLGTQFERSPFLDNPASPLRDYILQSKPKLYSAIGSQNPSQFYMGDYLYESPGTFGTSGNQETLNYFGLYGDKKLEFLRGVDMPSAAKTPEGSKGLQGLFSKREPEVTSMILEGVLDSVFDLIIDEYGHHLFYRLIEYCNDYQIGKIVLKIISDNRSLINASFNSNGSKSIQRLIKVLKKSPFATGLTTALATGFYLLMIHNTGRHVILQCLIHLSSEQNEVLYEAAIQHFIDLATHAVGCLSLKSCISSISGPHRDRLLHNISEHSVFLSQDPSGNYVMQFVLDLHNPVITGNICRQLRGHYTRLSLQQSGSHVVEKCLDSAGMIYVIEELVTTKKLLQVAHNQFGNYVIQKALKITKCADIVLHQCLEKALEPLLPSLHSHLYGKNVYNLIKGVRPVHKKKNVPERSRTY